MTNLCLDQQSSLMNQPGIINIIGPSIFNSGMGLTGDGGNNGLEMVDLGEGGISSVCLGGESESRGGVIVCDGIINTSFPMTNGSYR